MESRVAQHDTPIAIKKEFPTFVNTKVENEEEEQQHSNYAKTIKSNLDVKYEEVDIKLEEINYGSFPVAMLASNLGVEHTLTHQNTLEDTTSTVESYTCHSKYTPSQRKQKLAKKTTSRKAPLKCEQCSYVCNYPGRFHLHMRVHKDPSELDMYECTQCGFKTKHKNSLREHSVLHKDAADISKYKCNSCDFESKRKGALTKHIYRQHRSSKLKIQEKKSENKRNERGLLTCEQCSYECKHPSQLQLHTRIHKDPSELDMYKCTQCDFITKHKNSLKGHSIVHKDTTEMPKYKCNSCDFETKRKGNLRKHIKAIHQGSGRYKCSYCFYEHKLKHRLKEHMLTHRVPLETL